MNHLRYLLIFIALLCSACVTTSRDEAELEAEEKLELAREQFLKKDYESSAITLLPLVRDENPDAQYSLGYLYYYGLGLPRNINYGRQLIQAAAEQGNETAIEAITLLARQTAALGPTAAHAPIEVTDLIVDPD